MPPASLSTIGRRVGRAAAAVMALVFAASCTGADSTRPGADSTRPGAAVQPAPTPHYGGSVTFGLLGAPTTLDPYSRRADYLTYAVVTPLYPSLFRFRPSGSAQPYLAARLKGEAGGVRVVLRKARWSNGAAITARDVAASIARARKPSGFAAVTRVSVVGKRVVALRGNSENWPRTLATAAFVLPGGKAGGRVSGGPYKLSSVMRGRGLDYVRNRSWFGSRAYLHKVRVRFVADLEPMLLLLQRGRLDAAAPPYSVNLLQRLRERGLSASSLLGWESIALDLGGAGPRVRRAVTRNVDRLSMVTQLVGSGGRLSNTLYPAPGPGGARGPWAHAHPGGSSPHGTITLAAENGDELGTLLQQAVRIDLMSNGFSVDSLGLDPSYYRSPTRESLADVAVVRRVTAPGVGSRRAGYDSKAWLPLAQVDSVVAFRPGLSGLSPNPTYEGPLWNMQAWFRSSGAKR